MKAEQFKGDSVAGSYSTTHLEIWVLSYSGEYNVLRFDRLEGKICMQSLAVFHFMTTLFCDLENMGVEAKQGNRWYHCLGLICFGKASRFTADINPLSHEKYQTLHFHACLYAVQAYIVDAPFISIVLY